MKSFHPVDYVSPHYSKYLQISAAHVADFRIRMEAAKAIRALERPDAETVPIIALTANAVMEDRKKSQEAGMNAHLTKPLNMKTMIQTITKLLRNEQ